MHYHNDGYDDESPRSTEPFMSAYHTPREQRHDQRRRRKRQRQYQEDDQDHHQHIEEEKCRFPKSHVKWNMSPFMATCPGGLVLLLAVIIQIFLVVLMCRNLNTETAGFETKRPEFAFYKNTAFKNCSSFDPDPAVCRLVTKDIVNRPLPYEITSMPNRSLITQDFFPWDRDLLELDLDTYEYNYTYSWCDAMRCFKGYKVIPSSPYPSAYLPNRFIVWDSGNMAAVAYLISFVKYCWERARREEKSNKDHHCKGLGDVGIVGWILNAYVLIGPFGWWWYSFFYCVAKGWWHFGSMSFAAWTVTWHSSYELRFHPYSCVMSNRPRLKILITSIARFFVFAQWATTGICMHFWWLWWDVGIFPVFAYQCHASDIADAPGTTPCSSTYLCSSAKSWMRMSQTFWSRDTVPPGSWIFVGHFWMATVSVISPYIWAFFTSICTCSMSKIKKRARSMNETPLIVMVFAALYIVVWGFLYMITGGGALYGRFAVRDRWGSVAVDEECHAVHVHMSPWKHFMDVDTFWRPVWLAKAWFNA